jgi:hypothetical protein
MAPAARCRWYRWWTRFAVAGRSAHGNVILTIARTRAPRAARKFLSIREEFVMRRLDGAR